MISQLLAQRERDGHPIRVGIVGAGKFGTGVVAQVAGMKGMTVAAIADINLDGAKQAFEMGGITADLTYVVRGENGLEDAIRSGKGAIMEDAELLARSDSIDVVVESTGIPDVGARIAHTAILHNKHVVMVNVEADVTVGPYLKKMADAAGVVYSLVDGDQPGCTMNMVEWAESLGFEIVAAGRGTIMLDDDREGVPDSVPQRFDFSDEMVARRRINFKMYNSFRDGTKAQTEMTALSNMTGLPPDVRGMHEPAVAVADIARVMSHESEGGILSRSGVVELANSVTVDGQRIPQSLGMGVFVVIRTDHPFIQEDLSGYIGITGGDGKNFLLHRAYHLVAVEAPITIAKAALYGMPTGSPVGHVSDLITVAKRDLKEGELIDGGGGYTVNGLIEKADVAQQEGLLPLGLAIGARTKRSILKGEAIGYADVEVSSDSFIYKIRQLQDESVKG
jgi:predicted homoserine dehydrogenase-like protein